MIDTFYIIMSQTRWRSGKAVRLVRKESSVRGDQHAIKVTLQMPDDLFDAPKAELVIGKANLIQPKLTAQ